MEVHAHTHTPRKKWTHYFWEFLMLFLAVTLGFFVENQREHYIEHKRVKVLVSSLLADLQKDTAQLNLLEQTRLSREKSLDSFFLLLHRPPREINQENFYRLIRRLYGIFIFSQSTGTLDQLKNAGYLRYFSDNKLLQHISDYEFSIQDYKVDENIGKTWYDKFLEFTANNMNPDIIDSMMQQRILPKGIGIPELSPIVIRSLTAIVIIQRANNKIMKRQNIALKAKAGQIMDYLHSNYR